MTQFKSLDILLDSRKIIPHYAKRSGCSKKFMLSPIYAELHYTSNCNYDCIHCSYGSRRMSTSYLKHKIIENLISDLIDINCHAVYFSGGGEPTVIKRWDSYADRLISNNIEVALITNGVAIQQKHIATLQKMNYIAISVYSTQEERYKKITGSNAFDQQFILPSKVKNSTSDVIVGARCVLNKTNCDELYEIYNYAISSGFDYIIFIPAVDYEGAGIVLEEQWIELVKKDIKKNIDKFDHARTNVKSILDKNISHYNSNNNLDDLLKDYRECSSVNIRSGVFFNYDGGVYLCQPDIGNRDLEIGNLNDDRFINIWNSPRHKEVVDALNERWAGGDCKNCRAIALNRSIYDYEKNPVNIENLDVDYFL